jgi:hypothetical protein
MSSKAQSATPQEIVKIVGPLDDAVLLDILRPGGAVMTNDERVHHQTQHRSLSSDAKARP